MINWSSKIDIFFIRFTGILTIISLIIMVVIEYKKLDIPNTKCKDYMKLDALSDVFGGLIVWFIGAIIGFVLHNVIFN
jgi:hypothetical protein